MAKRRRKPLTKAEAGRLGGKATVRKYGKEHMRTDRQGRLSGARQEVRIHGRVGPRCDPLAQPQRETARPRQLPGFAVRGALGTARAADEPEAESGGPRS